MANIVTIGLEPAEVEELKSRWSHNILAHEMLPRMKMDAGQLLVEDAHLMDRFHPVDRVLFHGIFDNDFPLISLLALWSGPCFPNAFGLMTCRFRIPCLAHARRVSRYANPPRSYAAADTDFDCKGEMVAKWGEWHCGENKELVSGKFHANQPTLLEPYVPGTAMRIHISGEQAWQIRMAGTDWKKSIHHDDAAIVPCDPELLADAKKLQEYFGLEILAVDYIIGDNNERYLLEVNHIPNVTLFGALRQAYLDLVTQWVQER